GLRQPQCPPDDGPDVGGGVRTELEANLNAAGALERYQYWSDNLERCFSNNASEASHDRHQPQSPSDYKQSSERERREHANKPRNALRLESLAREQPNNHSAAALHLVPRGRPQASIVLSA